jgi:hypothetical protein
VEWIHLTQDEDQWLIDVNTEIGFRKGKGKVAPALFN